jgi:hypothetical protein
MISCDKQLALDELLTALDEQVVLLRTKRDQMAGLSAALISRNNEQIEKRLSEMERSEVDQAISDERLRRLRARVAETLGCPESQSRLIHFLEYLSVESAELLRRKREAVIVAATELRKQHLRTVMQLTESARINRILLESLIPSGESISLYGRSGSNYWRSETGLVDTEL